ncbi:Protein N-acetyltransferase, RimJ/RimL family [Burkholderia sp. D7]|nr:Protein N-acetyltransferase, RimJ/RimL family [Burkholderia sp. D7]
MKLIAERLYLRDLEPSDIDAVHEYASSPEVVLHQEWGPNTIEQTRDYVAGCVLGNSMPDGTTLELAAVLNDGSLIGSYRATLSEDGTEAEIGYSLNPRYWHKGYATEAAKRLIDYLVSERNVREIFATSRPENLASIRVIEKLGMQQVDLYRKNVLIRGEWRDTLVFSVKV